MRSWGGLGLLVFAFAAVSSLASPAHAWTRTVVQSARATVEVEPEGSVYVLLRLDVEVHAGWLHELELVDLGEDVELDRYRPPYFRSEEGEISRPEAELHEDGRIRLWDRVSGGALGDVTGTEIGQVASAVFVNLNLLVAPQNPLYQLAESDSLNLNLGQSRILDTVFAELASDLT